MLLDKINVLLVDDHEPNLIALEQILHTPSINIHKACSGQQALGMMLDNEYALVLLDVNMPEMNGFEVAKLMQSRKETRHLPICFVTAISKEEKYALQGYEAGAVDYLYKPLDANVVKSKVGVFVELFRLRKQNENRLQVIESSVDGIAILNRDMRFTFLNPAFLAMSGYTEQRQWEEKSWSLMLDESSDLVLHNEILPALARTGQWCGELGYKHAGGSTFPVSVSLNHTKTDTICITRNISQRKAAEDKMRMLESVVENANDMVVITDPSPLNGKAGPKIRYVNPAFERITGYTKEEVIGRTPRILQGKNTDREQLDHLKKSLKRGEEAHIEVLNYTKKGQAYYNDIHIVPVKNRDNEIQYFTSIQRDTTKRRLIEEDLKRANKELEVFAYITSHDMRAPLVNLKGFCGELEQGMKTLGPAIEAGIGQLPEAERADAQQATEKYIPLALHYIRQGTKKLELITSLLLELSRTGRRKLHFEKINTKRVVENCLATLNHQINEGNITVTVDELPDTVADVKALEQIFGNLLDNAIKYLDPSRSGNITIHGKADPCETIYSVADNGRGIPENQLHKVFEVFRRVGDVGDIPGDGMGIAFIKTLIYRHKGRIWCESKPAQGTTFFFSITHNLAATTLVTATRDKEHAI